MKFTKLFLLIFFLNITFLKAQETNLQDCSSSSNLLKFEQTGVRKQSTQDVQSLSRNITYYESLTIEKQLASKKSPWAAFGLSLLYPGLGQLYNAEYGKMILIGGIGTVGLGLAMLAAMSTNYDSESNPEYISVLGYTGAAIWGGAYLWSLIDAPISANNINERNRLAIKIYFNDANFAMLRHNAVKGIDNYWIEFSYNF